MTLVAPALANVALKFGPAEYASLILCGLLLAVYLSEGSLVKGLLMMMLGLLLGIVGIDPMHGEERFTFGILRLTDGISFIPVVMGLFALSEVLVNLESPTRAADVFKTSLKGVLPTRGDWRRSWAPILRGTLIGFFVGALPGAGGVIASFSAYAIEKKVSKHPEEFGQGAIEGVASPEAANNASATGAFVPLLTLGIPGSSTTAMVFVALMIHGIQPGPLLLQEHPNLFWGVITSMYIGNVMLLVLNLPLIGFWVRLLKVPYQYLAVLMIVIVTVGSYQHKNSAFHVGLLVIFGALGYLARKTGFPAAPCILAMILGPMLEKSVQQALRISGADLGIFVKKPISAAFLIVALLGMLIPLFTWARKRRQA